MSVKNRFLHPLKSILNSLRAHKTIKACLRSAGISKLPMNLRLFFTILIFSLTKYPDDFTIINNQYIEIDDNLKDKLEQETILMCGWIILMAYDDFIDKNNLENDEIFDQLSRCLAGFLMAQADDRDITANKLKQLGQNWKIKANTWEQNLFTPSHPCSLYDFIFFVDCDEILTLSDFLYKTTNKEFNDQINTTIISAIELGKAYTNTRREIINFLGPNYELNWNLDFLLKVLTRAAQGQIDSPLQRNIDQITWKMFINIGYNKSNCFADGLDCLRNIINQSRFLNTRFHRARFCEQFLDDVQDYFSDAEEGIIGFFQAELIFQGQLAEQILSTIYNKDIRDREKVSQIHKLLNDQSYSIFHENALSCFNSELILHSKGGKFKLDIGTFDNFVLALMMEHEQTDPNIREILRDRVKRYKMFSFYWKNKNFQKCHEILFESQIPEIMVESFLEFMATQKEFFKALFRKHTHIWMFWVYYLVIVGIMKLFLIRYKLDKLRRKSFTNY